MLAAGNALLVQVPHLADELVRELVDRRLHVPRGLTRAQRAALEMHGRLGDLRLRDRRVPLDRELDLDLCQLVHAAVELLNLSRSMARAGLLPPELPALGGRLHRPPPVRARALSSNPPRGAVYPNLRLAPRNRACKPPRLAPACTRRAEGARGSRSSGAGR